MWHKTLLPAGCTASIGYTPMTMGPAVFLSKDGPATHIVPDASNAKAVKSIKRLWLPDFPRSSDLSPLLGADKLQYFHPTLSPKHRESMEQLLEQYAEAIPELDLVQRWMDSDGPENVHQEILSRSPAEQKRLFGMRVVMHLGGTPLVELGSVREAWAQHLLDIASNDDGQLSAKLNKLHSQKLYVPLYSLEDDSMVAFGQGGRESLRVVAKEAFTSTMNLTAYLEDPGHHVRLGDRFWVWGATEKEAASAMALGFGSHPMGDAVKSPYEKIITAIRSFESHTKIARTVADDETVYAGYVGMGGSGKGRAAIGSITQWRALDLLKNGALWHERQLNLMPSSKPWWAFAPLAVAEGANVAPTVKAGLFEAFINGRLPPPLMTKQILRRMQTEGIPQLAGGKLTNRQWAQLNYLALLAPAPKEWSVMEENGKLTISAPNVGAELLQAWAAGLVYRSAKYQAICHQLGRSPKGKDWETKTAVDQLRQLLFQSPAKGVGSLANKVASYKQGGLEQEVKRIGDLSNGAPLPDRWTDQQRYYVCLGIAGFGLKFNKTEKTEEN